MTLTTSLLVVGRVTGHQKEQLLLLLFTHQVLSNSSRLHGLQHARLPCPSPSPRVCSNSCPLSPWCHPTMLSSVIPFSSCPQSFPASGSFPMSQLFASGGQSIGASASASVLLMNIQSWFLSSLTGWISLQSKRLSSLLEHHSSKASVLWCSAFFMAQLSHPYMTTGKTVALTIQTFIGSEGAVWWFKACRKSCQPWMESKPHHSLVVWPKWTTFRLG